MNQRQRASVIVAEMDKFAGAIGTLQVSLARILDDSQSSLGDRSISTEEYAALRQLERQAYYFIRTLSGAKECLKEKTDQT